MEVIETWWAAGLAAVICAIPAALSILVNMFADVDDLGGGPVAPIGQLGVPLAAPVAAAILVGPSGDLGTVLLVVPSVTTGLVTFYGAWELLIDRGTGGGSTVRSWLGTIAALGIAAVITMTLARLLPGSVGPVAALVVAWACLVLVVAFFFMPGPDARGFEEARLWVPGPLTVDGTPVELHRANLSLSKGSDWQLTWEGPAWGHAPGAARFQAKTRFGEFTGSGMLACPGDDPGDSGDGQPVSAWSISGPLDALRCDGRRVRLRR